MAAHPSAALLGNNKVQFLVSAGEASGDLYAAGVVSHLAQIYPSATFYGCAGPKLQRAGVEPIIDSASLAVVGLAEVVGHLPRAGVLPGGAAGLGLAARPCQEDQPASR